MNAFDPTTLYFAVQTLGWTLLHFLWQGALLGGVYFLLMGAASQAAPRSRYRMGLGLFFLMAMCPVFTFLYLFEPAGAAAGVQPLAGLAVSAAISGASPPWPVWEQTLEPYLPWAVAFWLAGVMLMSARVSWDWWQVRRLARIRVTPLPPQWGLRVRALSDALRVRRQVAVVSSGLVRVPAVVGWLKPVILLPAGALTGLDRRQLELIIAHELAHVRRADYLVNLFQVMVETLLFYHPVVRWVSNRLRAERELCCDDEVIAACGDALTYAKALAELEVQRQFGFQTALAASGGSLSRRIHRMLERPLPRRGVMVWGTSLMLGLAAGSMAIAAQIALRAPAPPPAPVATVAPIAPPMEASAQAPVPASPAGAAAEPAGAPAPEVNATRAPAPMLPPGATSEPAPASDAALKPKRESPPPAPPQAKEPDTHVAASLPTQAVAPDPAAPVPAEPRPAPPVADSEAEINPQAPAADALPAFAGITTPAGEAPGPLTLARATPAESIASRPPEPAITGGEPINLVAPEYPRRARLRGVEGLVVAEFTIDAHGQVGAIKIVQAKPAGVFNHAVTQALTKWRFTPLLQDGKAMARRIARVFEFNLDGVTSAADGECDPVTGTRICRGWIAGAPPQPAPAKD